MVSTEPNQVAKAVGSRASGEAAKALKTVTWSQRSLPKKHMESRSNKKSMKKNSNFLDTKPTKKP